jgi:cellulose synthase/poly-beta-1,6-N-acetylglucosamine synthase-like glycosyltransferase
MIYTLLGYPIILVLLSKFRKNPNMGESSYKETEWPKVTLVIAAYNEEKSIGNKLENSLKLNYPKDKLEIVVVSDHSSDNTDNIVRSYAEDGIRLHRMPKRGGKLAGHKSVLKEIKSEIVVFSDATTIYHKDAIKELVKHFVKKNVGCVGGAVTYKELENRGSGVEEQKYFSYEAIIRKMENHVDSVPVVSGAIYAIRKQLYAEIPPYLADDLINPLYVKKMGYITLFEQGSKCWETSTRNLKEEFQKRKRIGAQNVAGLFYMRSLLNPTRHFLFSWILYSHKVLRLVLPFLYVVILITCSILFIDWLNLTFFGVISGAILLGYLLIRFLGMFKRVSGPISLAMYFIIFHIGIILGITEALLGKKYATWQSE